MVEHSPQVLTSKEKATKVILFFSMAGFETRRKQTHTKAENTLVLDGTHFFHEHVTNKIIMISKYITNKMIMISRYKQNDGEELPSPSAG